MSDPFARPALDVDAVDLAWLRFQIGELSRFNARCSSPRRCPSTSGQLR